MSLLVYKYGGTSLDSQDKIMAIARKSAACRDQGHDLVVVVSAMGSTTDTLLSQAKAINQAPRARELSLLLATGEMVSSAILALAIGQLGRQAVALTGGQCGIVTDGSYDNARIVKIDATGLRAHLAAGTIVVVAGFQGEQNGEINVLGRGGSDATAVALASTLNADECIICSDVPGVLSADPRLVPGASLLPQLSYEEMLEMAGAGAQILMERAVEIAREHKVKLKIQPWDNSAMGTSIREEDILETRRITGIAAHNGNALISVAVDAAGQSPAQITDALIESKSRVTLLSLVPEKTQVHLRYLADETGLKGLIDILDRCRERGQCVGFEVQGSIGQIAIVGHRISETPDVVQASIKVLTEARIPILFVSTSVSRIAFLLPGDDLPQAANRLHDSFHLDQIGLRPGEVLVGQD